ncbi:unknown protein [Oryza sativa Japonica Group]|uniref:Os01g0758900 protein n=2 Tax=Oryza sativa subsp. japonica TaxID=39947 RepID=Q0JJ58_ORYSJ|nr:uncharacterized protein LOC4325608 isoform X2 [Oryza sativa Japonica Group]KAF2952381.1 hypothetical protein DAI22_01g332300 [Oryza sativa Japonica Group]BAD87594.1 unknown protein [Oryza sativa Japonica Group]BAF06220.1 Os01g0758900 [Oryza sativa Japonica Group]BAS74435.1 Os01g0758900 [Oryza sativa Japonica Group]|eukprot:NP_001044306.1 Os01g0758900 [Oryza sativa Japonica Group]
MRADRLMAEGGKRIDLGAPLRSVRHADALPYHKADLNSGPVRHPGAVPFVWEQRPGQPKSVRTRRAPPSPTTASHPQPLEHGVEDEIDGSPYHDALGEHYVGILHGVDASPACSRTGAPAPAPARDEKRAQVAEAAVLQAKKEVTEKQVVSVAAVLRKGDDDDDDEERFSDALDTLSRTESFTVNCSVSGLSGMPEPTSRAAAGAEAGVRGIMMDRFLPAAQAVAIGSPQYTFRKAGAASATSNSGRELARAAGSNASGSSGDDPGRRTPVQLPYQHLPPNYLSCSYPRREEQEDEDDDDDYDVHSTRGFASKGCGLLPSLCVKGSLLLLNPMPAMKRGKPRGNGRVREFASKGRGRGAPSPLARSSQNKHLGCASNGSWEDVYKHKLEQKYVRPGEDGRSKLTSESNQLTFWSDSQAGNGSSPFHHSAGGGMSPYYRDVVLSSSSKADESFGTGVKEDKMSSSNGSSSLGRDHDRGSLLGSDRSSLKGSSSISSGLDRPVHVESMDHRGDIDSETSHSVLLLDSRTSLDAGGCGSQLGEQIVGKNPIGKGEDNDPLTERVSEVTECTLLAPSEKLRSVNLDDGKTSGHLEDSSVSKRDMPLQSLLPLPVPRSPSESWLSRTLPSVTSKPPVPSFLGIQLQSKKQTPWASIQPKENNVKPPRPRQIRFADVVERPNSLDAEI